MAKRYPSISSSDNDDPIDLRGFYCKAITNLTGTIVPVLQHDKKVITEAFAQGLIGDDTYSMKDSAQQAKEFLRVLTEVKIKVKQEH